MDLTPWIVLAIVAGFVVLAKDWRLRYKFGIVAGIVYCLFGQFMGLFIAIVCYIMLRLNDQR